MLKPLITGTLYGLALHLGVIRLFYFLNRHEETAVSYHNVMPDELYDYAVHLGVSHSVSAFEQQLKIIARRAAQVKSGNGSFRITFDDGYINQREIAGKALDRHGLKATFFITLSLLEDGAVLWTDRMLMWLSYVPPGRYSILGETWQIGEAEDRKNCRAWLWDRIYADYGLIDRALIDMEHAHPFERLPIEPELKRLRFLPLGAQDLEDLAKRGHQIACHSYNHDILSRLSDKAIAEDFARCKAAVGPIYNSNIFSYPFGGPEEVGERELALCRASGFREAYMNVETLAFGAENRSYSKPRTSLPNTLDRYILEAKLSGFERFLKTIRA